MSALAAIFTLTASLFRALRYGENAPQAPCGLYTVETDDDPLALHKFEQVEGTEPSMCNVCDLDRLLQTMTHLWNALRQNDLPDFYPSGVCIAIGVKHGNPCGVGVANDPHTAIEKMLNGDPIAIFGGLVMCNFPIDGELASLLLHYGTGSRRILDGVIAPSFTNEARDSLARKHGKCRLLQNPALGEVDLPLDTATRFRQVRGGVLVQPNYMYVLDFRDSDLQRFGLPRSNRLVDLLIAWAICATSNSNTITIVREGMLLGNGCGRQDRVGAAQLALQIAWRGKHQLDGAVAASDSFFPFPDGVEVLLEAGVQVIFSTSGSINDHLVQELVIDHGATLYQLPDTKARGFFAH